MHLVDIAPMGVQEINERGVVHDGVEYDLDVLIYATGFEFMAISTFNMVRGRDGRTLAEKWQQEGTRTFLGLHTEGFPNLFIVAGPQGGGGSFNFTDAIDDHSDYIVWMLETMREQGHRVVDVQQGRRGASGRSTAPRPTWPPRRCGTASRTTTATARPKPGCLAYYGGGQWHKWRIKAQETLEPYAFQK